MVAGGFRPLVATGGHKQVTKRTTHARLGMHMQQCSAVPVASMIDQSFRLSTSPVFLL